MDIKKFFLFSLILCLILGLFSCCIYNLDENDSIKIPVILPITQDKVFMGVEVLKTLELAFEEINLNGGINGRNVELVVYDGECDMEKSQLVANKLVDEGYKIIVGGYCSDETVGASLVTQNNEVLLFSPSSRSSRISGMGDFIFRTILSIKLTGVKLGNVVFEDGGRKVAIVTEFSDYSDSLRKNFIDGFLNSEGVNSSGEIVLDEYFEIGQLDYSEIMEKIRLSDADSLVMFFQGSVGAERFVSQLFDSGIRLNLYSDVILTLNDVFVPYVDFLDGLKLVSVRVDSDLKKHSKFIENFKGKYGTDLNPNSLNYFYYSTAYDLPFILKEAMMGCSEFDSFCVRDNLNNVVYEGLSGEISFDVNGDPNLDIGVFEIVGDRFVLIE